MESHLKTSTSIDFLPVQYRQRGVKRRTYLWRIAVGIAFAVLCAVMAMLQYGHHESVRARLRETDAHYADAVKLNEEFMKVQATLQSRRHAAGLLTYLRHPWPRTTVLAAIMKPMTDGITLTDCQIAREASEQGFVPQVRPASEAAATAVDPSPHARDLKRLLEENEKQSEFVLLTGYATDSTTLHEYLARLDADPLIDRIELRSIEHSSEDPSAGTPAATVHFTARAILRPGIGQSIESAPAAPATPAPPTTTATSARGEQR